jgi:hypothetical protein
MDCPLKKRTREDVMEEYRLDQELNELFMDVSILLQKIFYFFNGKKINFSSNMIKKYF